MIMGLFFVSLQQAQSKDPQEQFAAVQHARYVCEEFIEAHIHVHVYTCTCTCTCNVGLVNVCIKKKKKKT